MTDGLAELRERLGEWIDLRGAAGLLEWDQQTMMPPRGGPARAEALATLERISHELFVSADTGRLLDAAAAHLEGCSPESDDARLVSVTRRRWEKARRVPSDLAADLARAGSIGQEAWVAARANSDYGAFAPHLSRNLELARRYVDCFDGFDCAYDVLLDDYDPGTKTVAVARLFGELRAELVPLIRTVSELSDRVPDSCLHGQFPVDGQRRLVQDVVARMGFDPRGWRMDDAVHPFAAAVAAADVRITTRWDETCFASGLYGAMHECGHGLYEDGIAAALARTPLGQGESLSLHESQSRLWENMVGRGRPFCGVLAPAVAERFGGAMADLDPDTLYRAVNGVRPSYIRVEADEATYGLHVVLRFELEQELIEGRLAVADLPDAWNARVQDYLGLEVTDDALGVLQDVHWSAGLIGYFPTYALGNLIAGQLWERAHAELPELDARISEGELAPLREWLGDRVHRHGAKFTSAELLERVLGAPISVAPFVSYLKRKLSDVYGVDLAA
ncbi:MAG: carboxypeptidase M32 [Solirubrobacteraceae bacterium]